MAEKAKVSREVAKVLDEVRACHEPTIDDFIKRHAKGEVGPDWEVLKRYRTIAVAHLIYSGDYEIEETPEEKILARWNNVENILPERRFYYREGILDTLRLLGVKIKGINK